MKSIVLILPYFGKFPSFFNIWLQSANNNPTIDFLILTDFQITYQTGENIHVVSLSFEEFKSLCQHQFPYKISLDKPYKLCDYKPFYGKILNQYVKSYDFWGFVDCDTVLGNIRKMISPDLLEKFNHLLCLGHLQLQRVDDPLFDNVLSHMKAQGKYNLEYVYTHPKNYCADELPYGLPLTYWTLYPDKFYCEYKPEGRSLYDELTPNYKQFVDLYNDKDYLGRFYYYHFYGVNEHVVPFWKRSGGGKSVRHMLHYKYSQGKLMRCYWTKWRYHEEEILYIHLYRRKMNVLTDDYDNYYVLPHKFLKKANLFVIWKETRPRFLSQLRLYWRRELKRLIGE